MSIEDTLAARRALALRLDDWGVPDASARAREFIDEMQSRGWQMSPDKEARRHPPRDNEACPLHPGEYRDQCRACAADRLVRDTPHRRRSDAPAPAGWGDRARALLADATEKLCRHHVPPNNCKDCTPATSKENADA